MASNGDLLWWVSRGTGLGALLALTATLTLGVLSVPAVRRPSFAGAGLHRSAGVAGLALVVVHVAAVVLDAYVPVGWIDGLVPFLTPYRRVWTGLGTLAFDVMLLAAVTSIGRLRPAYPAWKVVHVASWCCWPVAVAHGLATGTDTRAVWALVLTLLCVGVLAGGFGWRLAGRPWAAAPAALIGIVVAAVLTAAGPARADWARRAGTPAGPGGSTGAPSGPAQAWRAHLQPLLSRGLAVQGTVDERLETGSTQRAREVLRATLPGGTLTVVLEGPAYETGLDLQASAVTLGPTAAPSAFRGAIVGVGGGYELNVGGPGGDWRLRLSADIRGATRWTGELRTGAGSGRG